MSPTITPHTPFFEHPPLAFREPYARSNSESQEPIPEYLSQGSPVPPVQALTERAIFTAQDVLEGMVSSRSGRSARDTNRIGHLPGITTDQFHKLVHSATSLGCLL